MKINIFPVADGADTLFGFFGFDVDGAETFEFADIVGTEFTIVPNDNWFEKTEYGSFSPRRDFEAMYGLDGNVRVRIVGIIRLREGKDMGLLGNGIAYSDELAEMIIRTNMESGIVKAQKASEKNVITLQEFSSEDRRNYFINGLGGSLTPNMIMVFPVDFNAKDRVTEYLDEYNDAQAEDSDRVIYTDLARMISNMTGNIMDAITVVLIAFAAISLVVSLIMICIITYTSVLERTKEIGVLRALGARKKDITRVFDAETCILGVFSGVLGVTIAYLLTIPANMIIHRLTELKNVAQLPILYAVLLVIVSTILTMLGGHIPARMASKKDAVEALRTE